jgi:AraC-like DNA-binding protein
LVFTKQPVENSQATMQRCQLPILFAIFTAMNLFLVCFISGASFLVSFLLFFHPLQQNITANRWLGFFVFIIGCAFVSTYMIKIETTISNSFLFKCLNSLQFLLAPGLYISILYFVNPGKTFKKIDWLHFVPFLIYVFAETIWNHGSESISTRTLFTLNKDVSVLVRDILPVIALLYLIKGYVLLEKHKANLKLISSAINQISLDWLVQFLFILSITIIIWMNDALFGLPFLTEATNFVYTISVFFLAYFSIRQKTIFVFKEKDIKEISYLFENEAYKPEIKAIPEVGKGVNQSDATGDITEVPADAKDKPKIKRLSGEQVANLAIQLSCLMERDKLFLDNDLNLPTVAERLGISIHETSFLINETTKDNFYNFINRYRVEEAKKLLASAKMEELNILGIAFASGFNSKTTFNTTFKRIVGISPSQYSKAQKK